MRTKEEIIREVCEDKFAPPLWAMDVYAKEVAIDFGEWLDLNCDENTIASANDLFDKYLQEKSSLK